MAIPCNSAAIFVAELKSLSVPFLNIREVKAYAFVSAYPSVRRKAVRRGMSRTRSGPTLFSYGAWNRTGRSRDQIQDIISNLIEQLKVCRAGVAQVKFCHDKL